ncbi:MAG: hypothetical protein ACI3VR_11800 [Intestinibacter sp.]|uniref:hypothetical protein n=1 Tax=Intestinibacter sp. TaxID=1965304 RepID=UPI003F16B903
MGELLLIYIGLFIIAAILAWLTYSAKSNKSLSIAIILSFIFVIFIGYLNYSAGPSNYYTDKIIAVFSALLYLISVVLTKNNKIRPIYVKISSILILLLNLSLLIIL